MSDIGPAILCNVRQYWAMCEGLKGKERGKAQILVVQVFASIEVNEAPAKPRGYEVVGPEGFEPPTKRL